MLNKFAEKNFENSKILQFLGITIESHHTSPFLTVRNNSDSIPAEVKVDGTMHHAHVLTHI